MSKPAKKRPQLPNKLGPPFFRSSLGARLGKPLTGEHAPDEVQPDDPAPAVPALEPRPLCGGRGVLTYRGRDYPFRVSGLSLGFTVGASAMRLTGRVSGLRELRDFPAPTTLLAAGWNYVGLGESRRRRRGAPQRKRRCCRRTTRRRSRVCSERTSGCAWSARHFSPGKNALLHCTTAGSTPLPLDHESFAVSGPLALVGNAFYPVLVHRPAASLHASSPQSVALLQLRFTSLVVINSRWDLHP